MSDDDAFEISDDEEIRQFRLSSSPSHRISFHNAPSAYLHNASRLLEDDVDVLRYDSTDRKSADPDVPCITIEDDDDNEDTQSDDTPLPDSSLSRQ